MPSTGAPSTAWVGSLSQEHSDNWTICRAAGLWGSPNARAGKMRAGDELFMWKSQEGWLARCIATSDAYPVDHDHPAPWTDGADYKWLVDISVVAESTPPIHLPSPGGRQQKTGIHTITFSRMSTITAAQADAVRALFPAPRALIHAPAAAAREPDTGWGRGADRERNKLIEQAGINEATRHLEAQDFALTADRQSDGVGYDLEFSRGTETVHLEVKGIAGPNLAFNVTAKELDVAHSDPLFRLIAVTKCLDQPVINELTGPQLLAMNIAPTQYRVRP